MIELPLLWSIEWWEIFLGGICTIAIFSFLYKENPFFRIFEHFFIGIATSWGIIATIREFFWPKILKPMFGLDRVQFPDGSYAQEYNPLVLLYLVPMAFGMLYYCILTKRHAWLAQLVIGFSFGVGAGLAFRGIFTQLLPQLFDSWRPLIVFDSHFEPSYALNSIAEWRTDGTVAETLASFPTALAGCFAWTVLWGKSLSNWLFLLTLFTSLSYFFFTFKRRVGGLVERSSTIGRWMLMGCFGAFFGSTIMARMALLVERLEFLINRWIPVTQLWF